MTKGTKLNYFLLLVGISVSLLYFSNGIAFTITSPVLPKLHSEDKNVNPLPQPITTEEESWIASLVSLGACVGPVLGGYTADKFGRKRTLLVCAVPYMISYVLALLATSVTHLYISRFVLGIGVGCAYPLCAMYIGEVAEDSIRGLLLGMMGVLMGLGNVFSYSVGPYVSYKFLYILCILPILLFLMIFGFFIPESPYFLFNVNLEDEAKRSLRKLRRRLSVEEELQIIKSSILESQANKAGFKDLFTNRGLFKALVVSCGVMIAQQLTGICVVLSYTQSIFEATGTRISPELSSIGLGICTFVVSLISSLLTDRLGRRFLLLTSAVGISFALAVFGIFFFLSENKYDISTINWVPIAAMVGYNIFFNIGFGPIPWTILGELFPSHVKSVASTITAVISLLMSFLFAFCFPFFKEMLGMAICFWLFCFGAVLSTGFVYFMVPETKQKSLQEIQDLLGGVRGSRIE